MSMTNPKPAEKYGYDNPRYLIMDGRAAYDVDRAMVLDTAVTLKQAHRDAFNHGDDNWIYDSATDDVFPAVRPPRDRHAGGGR